MVRQKQILIPARRTTDVLVAKQWITITCLPMNLIARWRDYATTYRSELNWIRRVGLLDHVNLPLTSTAIRTKVVERYINTTRCVNNMYNQWPSQRRYLRDHLGHHYLDIEALVQYHGDGQQQPQLRYIRHVDRYYRVQPHPPGPTRRMERQHRTGRITSSEVRHSLRDLLQAKADVRLTQVHPLAHDGRLVSNKRYQSLGLEPHDDQIAHIQGLNCTPTLCYSTKV